MTSNNQNYFEEWKECRETISKFDDILRDLRKYGFTLITGLLTAGSFLGFTSNTIIAQLGVIIVTMVLVVVLYWLDCYYQSLMYGAVFRTRFLEIFRLDGGLTTYISAFHGSAKIVTVLHFLYIGLLIGTLVLGLFVASTIGSSNTSKEDSKFPMNKTKLNQSFEGIVINYSDPQSIIHDGANVKSSKSMNERIILTLFLVVGFLGSLVGIIVIYFKGDKSRSVLVREVSELFKFYLKFKDNELQIKDLEKELQGIFDKYI